MAKQPNIMRRGGSWVVNLRIDGDKIWQSFADGDYGGRKGSLDAAETFLAQKKAERRTGTYRAPVKVTFRVAAETWHEHGVTEGGRRGPWKATTRRDYRSVLDVHLLPGFGDLQLGDVTAERITSWRRERTRSGRLPRRQAEKVVAVLHGIFERARREYKFPSNPVDDVERLPTHYGDAIDFYSPEEVWALVRAASSSQAAQNAKSDAAKSKLAAQDAQDAAIFLTAAFTGLRRGELIALRVRAVDFVGSAIRVEGSYSGGELSTPKSGKPRVVPMVPDVASALSRLLDARGEPGDDELVFVGEDDYLDASALRRRYGAAQKKAGLRPLRFHDLRHTFGSLAINVVHNIGELQAHMGHADIKTTMRYVHHKSQTDAASRLAAAFKPTSAAGVLQASDSEKEPVPA